MKMIIRITLILVGAVFLIWFLLPFFTKQILNLGNETGIGLSLLLLLYGIFFNPVNRFLVRFWKLTAGKIVLCLVGAILTAILVLAILCMVCIGSGMKKTAPKTTAHATVIVLGCKVYGDRASLMLEERLDTALDYLNANPELSCIVSGGRGKDETATEASVMKTYLVERGIDADRIFTEDTSTDTHENLWNSRMIMETEGLPSQVAIVTNDFHEDRALSIAKECGLSAGSLPAGTAWWLFPTFYIREMYGILEDWWLE